MKDYNQTWRKLKDGTMELVSEEIVDRVEPKPSPREQAALEAIKDEPTDSPLRLAVESLLGLKTKDDVVSSKLASEPEAK